MEARKFFAKIQKNGRLEQLRERYYGHIEQLDYVGTRLYTRHVKQVLPEFRPLFQKAAKLYKLDWRLLAAIGYQESHWRPKAMSPTGVRGIMMLTQATAAEIGIEDRLDPEASIMGGAQYFRETLDRIPERIPRPDRIWLALAAYNVGFYHLDDARIITQMNGGDPDKWVDVKKNLPLLSQSKWYKKVEHGYARGNEPVNYVENIRIYYDLLVWLDNKDKGFQVKPKSPVTGVNSPAF
jgi:membrane-bound lytic murein transglycosylase F